MKMSEMASQVVGYQKKNLMSAGFPNILFLFWMR